MSELDGFTVSKWDSEDLPNHRSFQDIFGLREAFNIRGCKSADQRWLGVFDAGDPAGKKTITHIFNKWLMCVFPEKTGLAWESCVIGSDSEDVLKTQFCCFMNIVWLLSKWCSFSSSIREKRIKAEFDLVGQLGGREHSRDGVNIFRDGVNKDIGDVDGDSNGDSADNEGLIDSKTHSRGVRGKRKARYEKRRRIKQAKRVVKSPQSGVSAGKVETWVPDLIDLEDEKQKGGLSRSLSPLTSLDESVDILEDGQDCEDKEQSDTTKNRQSPVESLTLGDFLRQDELRRSYEYTQRPQNKTKPPLPEDLQPKLWAASRQALCETTTFFRSYHGGVYISKDRAYGYLLGGHSSQRDCYRHDGRLIISHGGGKANHPQGQMDTDPTVRALLNNYKQRLPLVLIADDHYAPFPYDLGKKMYVILGMYWIVAAWAEKDVERNENYMETDSPEYCTRVRYKFAFQYYEGQGKPWWLRSESPSEDTNPVCDTDIDDESDCGSELSLEYPSEESFTCEICQKPSPIVFKCPEGGMCLNRRCRRFFLQGDKENLCPEFDENFLSLRSREFAPDLGEITNILQPTKSGPAELEEYVKARAIVRGWCCPGCGQMCSRQKWECWHCPDCNTERVDKVMFRTREIHEFLDQENVLDKYACKLYKIYKGADINVFTEDFSDFPCQISTHYTFVLPKNRGKIHLLQGSPAFKARADELFKFYQEEAMHKSFLRRHPLKSHHARGQMLSNYFSQNSGVPYKYISGTGTTVPFDKAPRSVVTALKIIQDTSSQVLSKEKDGKTYEFNEILTAAYMERQKMSWHTDDEKGLGPNVASLSLGSIAAMHFRLRGGNHKKELTLMLRHGDVLVMEGAQIQKAYEHSVVPMNFRIAATARCIHNDTTAKFQG